MAAPEAWGISDVEQCTKLTRATIWKMYTRGEFPQPWYINRHRRWWKADILNWLNARRAATPPPTFRVIGGGK